MSIRVHSRAFEGELVVDCFAGGGGASSGIEAAIGRPVDIALNHDAHAIRMHQANHPETRHYVEDIWAVDPREACGGLPVGFLWISPDCKHFSRAKGAVPVDKKIRSLSWSALRWAKAVKPRIIMMENVPEIEDWGPLKWSEKHQGEIPDPDKVGLTWKIWLGKLRAQGYSIDYKVIMAADHGTPTTRQRLFLVARRDRDVISFPQATHGEGLEPWVPAHDVLDFSLHCPTIFGKRPKTGRPLADATMNRIAMGLEKFVWNGDPYIIRTGHGSHKTGAGIRPGCGAGLFRGQSVHKPLATICRTNDKNIVVPWLIKHYGGMTGNDIRKTVGTITARDSQSVAECLLAPAGAKDRSADVAAFLIKYYGTGVARSVRNPLGTVTTKHRFALVEVHGAPYRIVDIGMRMLQPHELYRAQGFPDEYEINADLYGKSFTQTQQVAMVGNSVCPPVAEAIVREQVIA